MLNGSSDQPERASGKGCGLRTASVPLRSCSKWGLPGNMSPYPLVVSYTTVPPLPVRTSAPSAVRFCGTILQLALTGRYPAPCPLEPGLSSRAGITGCRRLSVKLPNTHMSVYKESDKITTRNLLAANPAVTAYRNWNGSVLMPEAVNSVSDRFSRAFSRIYSATRSFIIFSILCPGSMIAMPAAKASCAVW